MLAKFVLWITAAVLVSYGLLCFISPQVPAGYAGLQITNGDAFAEIAAMYGGLQTGVGLFCAVAACKPHYRRAGLLLLVLGIGLLACGRLYAALTSTASVSAYTHGALIYEFTTAALAGLAMRHEQQETADAR